MMFRIMTIFFASISTISGKALQFEGREGQLQCGYLETSTGILQRTKSLLNTRRRGKREDVAQEDVCHFLQIDDDQIFTGSNCYRMESSYIKISPSAEFNVTKVLGFPDDNTLLISLDRSVPQD